MQDMGAFFHKILSSHDTRIITTGQTLTFQNKTAQSAPYILTKTITSENQEQI